MKFLLLLLIPFKSFSSVDVAFLELRNYNGELIQLEKNGRYAHVAISYQGNWLHSHPYRGVEIISHDSLMKIGTITIVTIPDMNPLKKNDVDKYLAKSYDSEFSWSDKKIYCSELVGKLLKIAPQPMTFDPKFWPEHYQSLNGQPGLSPDGIFRSLRIKESI